MTSSDLHPNLSLVVLAFNEEACVESFLKDCLAFLNSLPGTHEVLFVNDGSTDRTKEIAEKLSREDSRIRVFSHPKNLGMGAGMRTGYANARGDYISILAADGQNPPDSLLELMPKLKEADFVLSIYRNLPHTFGRFILSKGLRGLIRLFFGVSFRLEGIYLFPLKPFREHIGLENIRSDTFFFTFELIILALRRGLSHKTVSVFVKPRLAGSSKVANTSRIWRIFKELSWFRWRLFFEKKS